MGLNANERADMIERLRKALGDDENVLLAYLFGSCIHGLTTVESDVDVAVLLRIGNDRALGKLIYKVCDTLNMDPRRIDLVDLSKVDVAIKHSVIREGVKLVDKHDYEGSLIGEINEYYPDRLLLTRQMMRERFTHNGGVSPTVVERHIGILDEELEYMKLHILSCTKEDVIADPTLKRALTSSLGAAIESILDICKHVVAARRLGVVTEYKDFPLRLWERQLVPRDLADEISEYASLRNLIVHRYAILDYGRLYDAASKLQRIASRIGHACPWVAER